MKNKKIIVLLFGTVSIAILLISLIYFIIDKPDNILNSNDKNAIGQTDITKKSYGYPLINMLSYNDILVVDAGIYRFGDIDQNGEVSQNDIEALKIMIDAEKIGFTRGQIKLADVNEDGNINNADLELFRDYLKKNGNVKYDINSNLLEYCLSDSNDSSNCNWQEFSTFKLKEVKDYYVFVKQTNNERISESMFFSKEAMLKKEI